MYVFDRDVWIKWQTKFVTDLQHDSKKYGWSFDTLKNRLLKEFPRSYMIYITGMKRSGNHVIVNWMLKNCFESQIFFNNITSFDADLVEVWNAEHISPILTDRVICTFEQISLDFFESDSKSWCVIRDPYNWLASWMKHSHYNETLVENDILMYIHNVKKSQKKILYNEWFKSQKYRHDLASKLGFVNKDIAIDEVPKFGKGSSFDSRKFNGKGSKMDVLNRWRSMLDNPMYIHLVRKNYEEFEKIAKDLFDMKCPVGMLK